MYQVHTPPSPSPASSTAVGISLSVSLSLSLSVSLCLSLTHFLFFSFLWHPAGMCVYTSLIALLKERTGVRTCTLVSLAVGAWLGHDGFQ